MTTAELAHRLADGFEALAADLRAGADAAADIDGPRAVPDPLAAAGADGSRAGRVESWKQLEPLPGESYQWPSEPLEEYARFPVHATQDQRGSVAIGIGYADQAAVERSSRRRPYIVTFEVVGGKKVRPLVVFTATDDHDTTGDFVGVIKGKGPGGREMFSPGDTLPGAYAGLEIVVFRDHVSGPYSYNKLAVIARGGDVDPILDHARLQLRLRFS